MSKFICRSVITGCSVDGCRYAHNEQELFIPRCALKTRKECSKQNGKSCYRIHINDDVKDVKRTEWHRQLNELQKTLKRVVRRQPTKTEKVVEALPNVDEYPPLKPVKVSTSQSFEWKSVASKVLSLPPRQEQLVKVKEQTHDVDDVWFEGCVWNDEENDEDENTSYFYDEFCPKHRGRVNANV